MREMPPGIVRENAICLPFGDHAGLVQRFDRIAYVAVGGR
jgi:hypothetical protein